MGPLGPPRHQLQDTVLTLGDSTQTGRATYWTSFLLNLSYWDVEAGNFQVKLGCPVTFFQKCKNVLDVVHLEWFQVEVLFLCSCVSPPEAAGQLIF